MPGIPQTRREREVWEACDDLLAKGISPHQHTSDLIINRLLELGYKKGNPKQIYDYRKTWREARGFSDSAPESSTTSVLSDPIQRVVAQVRNELLAEAEQRILDIQAEADEKICLAQQQSQASSEQLHEVLQRLDAKDKEIQDLKQVNVELQVDLTQSRQTQRVSEARAHSFEKSLEQINTQVEELKNAHQNTVKVINEQFEQRLKTSQAEINELKTILEQQRHHSIAEIDQLKIALHKQEKEVVKAKTAEELIQKQYQVLKKDYDQQQIELEQLCQLKERLLIEAAEKNKTIKLITADAMQKQAQLNENENKLIASQDVLMACQKRIGQLEAEYSHANAIIKSLEKQLQEKADIIKKGNTQEKLKVLID